MSKADVDIQEATVCHTFQNIVPLVDPPASTEDIAPFTWERPEDADAHLKAPEDSPEWFRQGYVFDPSTQTLVPNFQVLNLPESTPPPSEVPITGAWLYLPLTLLLVLFLRRIKVIG